MSDTLPKDAIFNLNAELPQPLNMDEQEQIAQLDELSKKIAELVKNGGSLSEENLRPILDLVPEVEKSPRAGAVLGFILHILGEYPAMRELYTRLVVNCGELKPFFFYLAVAEEKMGNIDKALDYIQKLISLGTRNYWVFLAASRMQFRNGHFSESIKTANLAVYENESESAEPFILLARSFHALRKIDQMLECFDRIETIKGPEGLDSIGPLYRAFKTLYKNSKKFSQKDKE